MKRAKEIWLYHTYMYGDCDCYHCEKYKQYLSSKQNIRQIATKEEATE